MSEEKEKTVTVNFLEMMHLNGIRLRQEKFKLEMADEFLTILKNVSQLTPDTPVKDIETFQGQLRAMLNDAEDKLKQLEEDKAFIEMISKRGE